MIGEIKNILVIPHIKVHNANALSSPFTIGFPAMTAWLGAVHALQRQLQSRDVLVDFLATGVVSHQLDLQTYKGDNDFVHSIIGTGNPLDKTGARSAFIEEARCHLDVSLVIEFDRLDVDERDELIKQVSYLLNAKMKMAGGDIQTFKTPFCLTIKEGDKEDLQKLQRKLIPGYVIIERRDLMIDAMENEGADALEAIIDYLAIHHSCEKKDDSEEESGVITWNRQRKTFNGQSAGWIVPIATGFQAISELGEAKNQRDENTPHRFVESVVTLGEFKMPHRLESVEDMLWRYGIEDELYLCQQQQYEKPLSSESHSEFDDE